MSKILLIDVGYKDYLALPDSLPDEVLFKIMAESKKVNYDYTTEKLSIKPGSADDLLAARLVNSDTIVGWKDTPAEVIEIQNIIDENNALRRQVDKLESELTKLQPKAVSQELEVV